MSSKTILSIHDVIVNVENLMEWIPTPIKKKPTYFICKSRQLAHRLLLSDFFLILSQNTAYLPYWDFFATALILISALEIIT
jgi:hypothetical protein